MRYPFRLGGREIPNKERARRVLDAFILADKNRTILTSSSWTNHAPNLSSRRKSCEARLNALTIYALQNHLSRLLISVL
jgi:hypothetical protein